MKSIYIFILILVVVMLSQCTTISSTAVLLDVNAKPFKKLSEYQFFTGNLKDLIPNEGVLPYDLNSPLFSDYAEKSRFVWMPEGKSANYTEEGVLDFPVGAVLIKSFYYDLDKNDLSKGKQIVETRLLIKREDKWDALDYVWNETQTEAELTIIGAVKDVKWKNKKGEAIAVNYIVPNKNQCKSCHVVGKTLKPIGPKVRNLNKSFTYTDGEMNQLDKWAQMGYLTGYDASKTHPKVAQWDNPESGTLHERSMAYLDINCSHCHSHEGPANTTGLRLVYDEPLGLNVGIMKAPVATGNGSGGLDYSIVPGKPDESILLYRLGITDPGAMMPEIGRTKVHEEGVELIREWIAKMEI